MSFVSLQSKDVINVYDGKKIGYIADIELDWCQKCIRALIVEKMNFFHFFCFFKEPPVLVIPDDLGINKELANHLGCNFGGGMKCGSVCGAITSGLMILGARGIDSPAKVNQFIKTISNNHHGLINCADLLKENAKNGGQKKPHCDGMIQEVIELIDQMEKEND